MLKHEYSALFYSEEIEGNFVSVSPIYATFLLHDYIIFSKLLIAGWDSSKGVHEKQRKGQGAGDIFS